LLHIVSPCLLSTSHLSRSSSISLFLPRYLSFLFFFFKDPATTEIYTLSLHDALPISSSLASQLSWRTASLISERGPGCWSASRRSEEHTSELQSLTNLVCRLLLEKKKD